MSKYYTIHGSSVYIYSNRRVRLLDLSFIPESFELFTAYEAWRISPWLAVTEKVSPEVINQVEKLLLKNGFRKLSMEKEALDSYFMNGDEDMITAAEGREEIDSVLLSPLENRKN